MITTTLAITMVTAFSPARAAAITAMPAATAPKAAAAVPAAAVTGSAPLNHLLPRVAPALVAASSLSAPGAGSSGGAGLISDANSAPVRSDGTVEVTVSGPGAITAARGLGARVLASSPAAQAGGDAAESTITVKPDRLPALAVTAGVDSVQPIRRAFAQTLSTEAVGTSLAGVWQANGRAGAGAVVAVVDGGFAGLAAQEAAGSLPANLVVRGNHCADVNAEQHGTAVAEIVHQMAPGATLLLYCIDDTVGLSQVETELVAAHAQIVSCSLGFAPDTRGDGAGLRVGSYTSAATTVARARRAGVLWINAAGNSGADHWSGTFADRNRDGFADLNTTKDYYDQVLVGRGGAAEIALSWDDWPASDLGVNLRVDVFDATNGRRLGYALGVGNDRLPGTPVRVVGLQNVYGANVILTVRVIVGKSVPALHYDLSYLGEVSDSYFAGKNPARAAAGSVTEPATSPSVLAVGAAYWKTGALEPYSSRGPTIDGRTKPDLLGYDGVSSPIYGASTGVPQADMRSGESFFGTSAAAPAVAGAAALIKAVNPGLDAGQLEAQLKLRAQTPASPPTNGLGAGRLSVGDFHTVSAPAGAGYHAIAPVRVLDTRTGAGVRRAPLGAGALASVRLPAAVPADATSVVVNLTGSAATGPTALSLYSTAQFPHTTNLSLSALDGTVTVSATVTVNARHGFTIRNAAGHVQAALDVVGYFAPTGAGFAAVAPVKVLDTRTGLGAHRARLRTGGQVRIVVPARVPASATAVMLSVTAVAPSGTGWVSAFPSHYQHAVTVSYGGSSRAAAATMTNLALVGVSGRSFRLANFGGSTDVSVTVVGYFSLAAPGRFHALTAPVRIVDTRTGNGGRHVPLADGANLAAVVGGLNAVAYGAKAVWLSVTATPTVAQGALTVYPAAGRTPYATLYPSQSGRPASLAVVSGLGAGTVVLHESGGGAAVTADEFGWFG